MEVYVLVNKKKGIGLYLLDSLVLVLLVASFFMSCIRPMMIILVVFLGIAFYCVHFMTNLEYEYAYFSGDLKFAKIINKSRRKRIMAFSMEEVVAIAPSGHAMVSSYENNKSVVVKDLTSHDKTKEFYEIIANTDGRTYLVMIEPDEAFLKEIKIRYPMKVITK